MTWGTEPHSGCVTIDQRHGITSHCVVGDSARADGMMKKQRKNKNTNFINHLQSAVKESNQYIFSLSRKINSMSKVKFMPRFIGFLKVKNLSLDRNTAVVSCSNSGARRQSSRSFVRFQVYFTLNGMGRQLRAHISTVWTGAVERGWI